MDSVKVYFSKEEWLRMTDYEKGVYVNMKENYDKMVEMEIPCTLPYFMAVGLHRLRQANGFIGKENVAKKKKKSVQKKRKEEKENVEVKRTSKRLAALNEVRKAEEEHQAMLRAEKEAKGKLKEGEESLRKAKLHYELAKYKRDEAVALQYKVQSSRYGFRERQVNKSKIEDAEKYVRSGDLNFKLGNSKLDEARDLMGKVKRYRLLVRGAKKPVNYKEEESVLEDPEAEEKESEYENDESGMSD